MMLSTACFFIGMAMAACAMAGYCCIHAGAMSEHEEMQANDNRKAIDGQRVRRKWPEYLSYVRLQLLDETEVAAYAAG